MDQAVLDDLADPSPTHRSYRAHAGHQLAVCGERPDGVGVDLVVADGRRVPVGRTTSFPSLGCGGAAGYGQRAPVS
jgi:hypothetical protein